MGSAEPRSFSRGNRGIAGTLVFSTFDRDALLAVFEEDMKDINKLGIQKYVMNDPSEIKTSTGFTSIDQWDAQMSNLTKNSAKHNEERLHTDTIVKKFKPRYADELLPFDITLSFNEIITKCA